VDRKQLCGLIEEALTTIPEKNIEVSFESEGNIRIVVISNFFKGMNLSSRIDFLTEHLIDLITKDSLSDFHFIYNALTVNEAAFKVSETTEDDLANTTELTKIASEYRPRA